MCVCEGGPHICQLPACGCTRSIFPSDGSSLGGKGGSKESGMCLKGASFNQWELYSGRGPGEGSAGETT